jgi:predicted nucleic acid-binding protein
MMKMIHDVRAYTFSDRDRLLIDTNIWLSVYGPIPHKRRRAVIYSDALAVIKRVRSSISIDVIVVSEYINRYARMEFDRVKEQFDSDFKLFRASKNFEPVAKGIAISVMRILNSCARCNSGFPELNISAVLASFADGDKDFNDQIIADICKTQGLHLLTDDGDFNDPAVPIITANSQLLSGYAQG